MTTAAIPGTSTRCTTKKPKERFAQSGFTCTPERMAEGCSKYVCFSLHAAVLCFSCHAHDNVQYLFVVRVTQMSAKGGSCSTASLRPLSIPFNRILDNAFRVTFISQSKSLSGDASLAVSTLIVEFYVLLSRMQSSFQLTSCMASTHHFLTLSVVSIVCIPTNQCDKHPPPTNFAWVVDPNPEIDTLALRWVRLSCRSMYARKR